MNTEKIRGIYPVLYAFFDEGGGLDRGAMRRQVDLCVESGVHGVAVLGLGTEVNKLDLRERRRLLDWAAEDLRGRLPLAVTVSEPNIAAQIAFVRAAAEGRRRLGRPAAATGAQHARRPSTSASSARLPRGPSFRSPFRTRPNTLASDCRTRGWRPCIATTRTWLR